MFRLRNSLPLLLLPFVLAGCAGQKNIIGPQSEPTEVMGPPLPDTQVDSKDVPGEVYGPQLPQTETVVSTNVSVSTAISTGTAAAAVAGPPSPLGTVLATSTSTSTATSSGTSTASSTATAAAVTPPPAEAKLCLVLGPGMAKAMAEAAVLESIRKAKLPVHCVVGTEMGAIVGALYAYSNGSTNNLQWQLFKLNKDNYFAYPMLSLREPRSTGHKLNEFLRGVFHDATIDRLPIRFGTTAIDDDGDNNVDFDHGDLADALSASAAVPGIFDSWKAGDHSYRSSVSSEPAPIELAKKLGGNFFVLVDVLLEGGAPAKSRYHRAFTAARSVVKLQKKEANFTIEVNTGNIAFDDFGRKADILSAGAAAADKAMPDLKAAWDKWGSGQR